MAIASGAAVSVGKTRQKRVYRPKTPSQNASFLHHLASIDLGTRPNPAELAPTPDPQASYDSFVGCFQQRLFVCLLVWQHNNFRTSKHRMMKLGGRCIVQKSRPSSNLGS